MLIILLLLPFILLTNFWMCSKSWSLFMRLPELNLKVVNREYFMGKITHHGRPIKSVPFWMAYLDICWFVSVHLTQYMIRPRPFWMAYLEHSVFWTTANLTHKLLHNPKGQFCVFISRPLGLLPAFAQANLAEGPILFLRVTEFIANFQNKQQIFGLSKRPNIH